MSEEGFKRKLTAILNADAVGYSRLMRDDEDRTIRTLTTYRSAITALVEKFRGHVVDATSDNLLAKFSSVVDAVNCGVEIQRELAERNTELSDARKMKFRIGINLGDVVKEENRIYGDGVNIAARMESMAEPGGICISGSVHDSVESRLGLGFEYLGEQVVKNIDKPVRAYRVASYPGAAAHRVVQAKEALGRRWRNIGIVAAVVVMTIGGLTFWQYYLHRPDTEPASVEEMAYPLPDKPSIAVLPFDNMSGDPDQDYLADGISENITTALSYIPQLFVIARNSSFTYKGKPVKVNQISEELGVRYVLEGSVLRSEDKVRVTAQLIDALTGAHIWSERYDRSITDIFDLMDEITLAITVALQVNLTDGEQARMWFGSTHNFEAWGNVVKGMGIFYHFSKEGMAKSRELFEKAIEIDPEYSFALTMLGWTHKIDAEFGFTDSKDKSFKLALDMAKKSLAMNDKNPNTHSLLSHLYMIQGEHEKAIEEGREAIAVGPSDAEAHILFGEVLYSSGMFEESVEMCEKALRLHPHAPLYYFAHMSFAYYWVGRFEDALAIAKTLIDRSLKVGYRGGLWFGYQCAAIAHIRLGQENEARESIAKYQKVWSGYNLDYLRTTLHYNKQSHEEQIIADLRKAGAPDHPPLPLPDKPSIAVLAFENISDDPEQEYFSDGITDDLITDLSKISGLFVVARNSTFSFKGQHKKVQQIGKELGVRYVLEGSVRKYEDKVRINAQLIDAQTGGHLWAERYDRDYKEIFALQDEVINKIVSALSVTLTSNEKDQIGIQKTVNMKAYDFYLRGLNILHRIEGETIAEAKTMFEMAIENDPGFSNAYAAHAMANQLIYRFRIRKAGISFKKALKQAHEYVNKALKLNPKLAAAYSVLGSLELAERHFDKAIEYSQKAVSLDPNDPEGYVMFGYHLTKAGEHQQALETIQEAFRLNPIPPHYYYLYLGNIQINNRQYRKAIESIKKAGPDTPRGFRYELVVSHVYLGEMEEAKKELNVIEKDWRVNIFSLNRIFYLRDKADQDHWLNAFRKLGVKEYPYTYEGDEKNILSKEEVLDLIVDKKITGIDPKKGQFWIHHTKDGKWRSTGAYKFDGTYWLEDNKLCHTVSSHPGFIDYVFFYRNPGGTSLGKNEYYMHYPFFGTWTVSVEK